MEITNTNNPGSLGDQELELLRYVADNAPASVRDVVDNFGTPRGLARTTVLTVMERLRKKGFLTRLKDDGVFQYTPSMAKPQLLQNLVGDFVQKTLGGSLSPFVAYLTEARDLEDAEIAELRKLVDQMEHDRKQPK